MDQLYKVLLTCFILAGIAAPEALAQEPELPQEAESSNESQLIEEITVIGEKTFSGLRLDVEVAETEAYNLFNELNSNDEFDVTCTEEIFLGSRFKQRTCMPAFLRDAQARDTQDYLNGIDSITSVSGLRAELRQKSAAMEAEMLRLSLENQQFTEALLKLTLLTGEFEKRKKANPFYFGQ